MKAYKELSQGEMQEQLATLRQEYEQFVAKGLKLNMSRGKPSPEQLELSMPLLNAVTADTAADILHAGTADDLRNYGGLVGLPEARELMAGIIDVDAEDVIVCGNSSLNVMYDMVSQAFSQGIAGQTPWAKLGAGTSASDSDSVQSGSPVKFLCPVPGYDRHFALTEHFGIEMIPVPLTENGPDMDIVEHHVNTDASVKGIWCVPKYSNPTGGTYCDDTVRRFAALSPAAKDFRIYWDNAYAVHDFEQPGETLLSLKDACIDTGNENIWYMFASTSKVTFAGAGIAAFAASPDNLAEIRSRLSLQTIGSDKLNQLRHVLFLRNIDGVRAHMQKHASIVAPKFETVLRALDDGLTGSGIGEWTRPKGGYFISFVGLPGTAKRVVSLAKNAGMMLTGAGATYPYGDDAEDSNIRLAPTYPLVEELEDASKLFVLCVKIASLEALLA
ncbi:MAG: aminotransferase [Coriobacteriia bacterium]|nr:aminotransferase [Coriobacteriia bacterium]MCL2746556.1 aminotransferase [Coriobacteriia bacterium]MCL2870373.1 aminotransferase [Coriobacteriia bacterium]